VRNPFYKFIIVDLDDVTIIIQRMGMKLKKLLLDAKIMHSKVKLYAFSSVVSDTIIANCKKGGFTHFLKPSKLQALDALRHMLADDEELNRDADKIVAGADVKSKGTSKPSGMSIGDDSKHDKSAKSEIERESLLDGKRQVIKRPT